MKIGLLIEHAGLASSTVKALASRGDELGYYAISLRDDSRVSIDVMDTWSLLPAVALSTRRARILPLVTDNLVRHPGILAKMASTVDLISGGRFIFGIGAGLAQNAPDYFRRIRMLGESVQVISKLWTEDLSSFKGEFFNLENAESLPKPVQKPHPPILLGGSGDPLLQLAARHGEMSNFYLRGFDPKKLTERLERLKAYCEKEGRDYGSVTKTVTGKCVIGKGEEKYAALSGTPDQATEQLAQFERLGIDLFITRFTKKSQADDLKQFAEKISVRFQNPTLQIE